MRELALQFVIYFNYVVIVYAVAVVLIQGTLLFSAAGSLRRSLRRDPPSRIEDIFAHPSTPGMSVLVAAYNEERTIVECVRSVLAQRYPQLELIVVDDGSTDETFAVLEQAFDLVPTQRAVPMLIETEGQVLSIHAPREGGALLVVRKENAGRCADALNAGLNVARMPLICTLDADSVLEPDALLHVARPLVENPGRILAAGGVVRPSNGMRIHRGNVERVVLPKGWLVRMQIVEYLRSFMLGRVGWTALDSLLIISGAFGAYRREDVLAVGGLTQNSLGQDADLVASLHMMARQRGQRRYRMMMVPQAVCWSEAPQKRKDLRRQRIRWAHGLVQVLWRHRRAMANPRYGRFGMVVLPYHLLIEAIGPIIELLGLPVVALAWYFGVLNAPYAIAIFVLAVGFGLLVSMSAVLADEWTKERYSRWRDVPALFVAAFMETTVLRLMLASWRTQGLFDAMFRRKTGWASVPRTGYTDERAEPAVVSAADQRVPAGR